MLRLIKDNAAKSDLLRRILDLLEHNAVADLAFESYSVDSDGCSDLPIALLAAVGVQARFVCLQKNDYTDVDCDCVLDRIEVLHYMQKDCMEEKSVTNNIYVTNNANSPVTIGDNNKVESAISTVDEKIVRFSDWQVSGLLEEIERASVKVRKSGIGDAKALELEKLSDPLKKSEFGLFLKRLKGISDELKPWLAAVVELVAVFVRK